MKTDCLLLGAGISGLTAARTLRDHGLTVQLVDKGRGVGGRLATRRLGERDAPRGRWDHGAQFATFRSASLRKRLAEWNALEVLEKWIPSHTDHTLMRRRPREGINAFSKAVAGDLPVARSQRIVRLEAIDGGWRATSQTGDLFEGATCICTLPAPQLIDLVTESSLAIDAGAMEKLHTIRYQRTLTLLAELEGPSGLPTPGLHRPDSGVLDIVIDNTRKGISDSPTLTAHATPEFSLEWYDRDRDTAASVMRAAVGEIVQNPVINVQIHGWKFSKPVQRVDQPYLSLAPGLFAAGDGYRAGDHDVPATLHPRIESAMLSGLAAADALADRVS